MKLNLQNEKFNMLNNIFELSFKDSTLLFNSLQK